MKNVMDLQFSALSENESFARVAVGAFIAQLDPTMEEMTEIKTVVSEAVTNAIIHGYNNDPKGIVYIHVSIEDDVVELIVRDEGIGIQDIDAARQPLFTKKPKLKQSGMGVTNREKLTDKL